MNTDLQSAPSVGPSIEQALLDPCVKYSFRCAVYWASTPNPDPELLKWWNWKDG